MGQATLMRSQAEMRKALETGASLLYCGKENRLNCVVPQGSAETAQRADGAGQHGTIQGSVWLLFTAHSKLGEETALGWNLSLEG